MLWKNKPWNNIIPLLSDPPAFKIQLAMEANLYCCLQFSNFLSVLKRLFFKLETNACNTDLIHRAGHISRRPSRWRQPWKTRKIYSHFATRILIHNLWTSWKLSFVKLGKIVLIKCCAFMNTNVLRIKMLCILCRTKFTFKISS